MLIYKFELSKIRKIYILNTVKTFIYQVTQSLAKEKMLKASKLLEHSGNVPKDLKFT